jgi:hypothetical protein
MFKRAFGERATERTQTFSWYNWFRRLENRQRRPTKYNFGDSWHVRSFAWNMRVNCKVGFDHATALREGRKQEVCVCLDAITWLWFLPTPDSFDLAFCIASYFSKWKRNFEGVIFRMSPTFRNNSWRHHTRLQKFIPSRVPAVAETAVLCTNLERPALSGQQPVTQAFIVLSTQFWNFRTRPHIAYCVVSCFKSVGHYLSCLTNRITYIAH